MNRVFVILLFLFIFSAEFAYAGFGVTPPYVRNTSLIRSSTYEQQILLVRGDPDVPLKAQISIDAPEIQDWIEIVEGNLISLPRGVQKVPMTVRVIVPKDVAFKEYKGAIRIRTVPDDGQVQSGAVSISLGAQIDIALNVIDKEIHDFRIRKISVSDLNEGHKFAWLYFPGKITFGMLLENTGNVDISPSNIEFNIYDFSGTVLLEKTKHIGKIEKVLPYATKEIFAEIPTRLPAGNYIARYKIYNSDEIKQEGEVNLSILKFGTLQEAGFGFAGLSIAHKVSLLLPVFIIVIVLLYIVYNRRLRRQLNN